jgi:hypothetical protein
VLKAGTIEFSGSKVDCLIRNVPATGAALEVNSPLWFPDVFVLVTTSDGTSRRRHIVRRYGKRIGVTFDD